MSNRPTDPQRGTSAERSLRATFRAQEIAREARLDQLEARLTDHARRIDALLAAERAAARDRVAAEVAAEQAVAEAPAPVEGHLPGTAETIDELAARSALGSEPHLEWRRRHVPKASPYSL